MPSTLTGVGASAAQSTSPTASAPADGDSLAASGVQGPIQTILNHIAKLWAGAFTGQTTTSPGVTGTGGATAPGVAAVAGGGGTPARGALAMTPQAAPSAPTDGDLWIETGSNTIKARVNGATQTLTAAGTTPVAITPGGGWGAAGSGLAYWKDASGIVHMKGTAVWLTGSTTMTTLPVGFRPLFNRQFPAIDFASGTLLWVVVAPSGAVSLSAGAPSNNDTVYFDDVSFLGEQ